MAEPLKNAIGADVVGGISAALAQIGLPAATIRAFEARAAFDEALGLMERGAHIADALRAVLPDDGAAALQSIVAMLGPEHTSSEIFGLAPLRYLPHSFIIGMLGPKHLDEGLLACRELTKRFTSEWCIRPLLIAHPERVFRELTVWSTDPNVHVRRLVSEGTRPRLPWATRIRWEPTFLDLLETLKDDPAEYVRRSVANHLGDVAKDDLDLVVATTGRWLRDAPDALREQRIRLVRHALRHPIKQGHAGALRVLGYDSDLPVKVEGLTLPEVACIGDTLSYTFEVINPSEQPQDLVIDIVVGYRKARGQLSPKTFKLSVITLGPNARRVFSGTLSLQDRSIRRHHPGSHTLAVQINGRAFPAASFLVTR